MEEVHLEEGAMARRCRGSAGVYGVFREYAQRLLSSLDTLNLWDKPELVGGCLLVYAGPRLEERTLLMTLAAATPTTIAMMLMRTSRAMDTADGDSSIECLMFKVVNAMACLTPTSEMSICKLSDD